jgi:hypothetical protein
MSKFVFDKIEGKNNSQHVFFAWHAMKKIKSVTP